MVGAAKTKLVNGKRVNIADNTLYGTKDVYSPQQQAVDTSNARGVEHTKNQNMWGRLKAGQAAAKAAGGTKANQEAGRQAARRAYVEKTFTPTVVSDSSIREKDIPRIKSDANTLLPPPQNTQNPQDVSGSETQNTQDSQEGDGNEYSDLYESVMGTKPQGDNDYYDTSLKLLDDIRNTSDQRTQSYIKSLQDVYKSRAAEMQQANQTGARQASAILQAGGGGGSISSARIISGVERAGIQKLSTLDAEEKQLEASALADQTNSDYENLGKKLEILKDKRAEKLDTVASMWKDIKDEKETEAKVQEEKQKTISKVQEDAAANDAPPDVIKAIGMSEDPTEAYIAAGHYLVKANSLEEKAYNSAKMSGYSGSLVDFHRDWEAAGRKPEVSEGGGAPGYKGDFAATVGLAANTQSSVYGQKAMKDQLETAIADGDYASAYQGILQAAGAGLTAENKTKLQNASIDDSLLADLSTTLAAYKAAGGDMNLAKEVANNAGKDLGVLAVDKPYAELAVQLNSMFQQYRQNMTGAAFGAKESSEYARVRPKANGSFDLNEATINGARKYADNYIKGAIRATVGQGGVEIKDRAHASTTASPIVEKDKQSQSRVEAYMAQSPENQAAAQAIQEAAPGISAEELASQLGI